MTGAGSGIGRASAKLFAAEGAKVVVADYVIKAGQETVDIIQSSGSEATFIEADVSKAEMVGNLIKGAVAKYGSLEVLFNNAGINLEKTVTDTSDEELDRVLGINLKGVFLCSKFAIPEMIQSGGGAIINTASIRGLVPQFHLAAYSASKAGVILLTKSIALDYGAKNIRANCICPGPILTPMNDAFLATVSDPEKQMQETVKNVPLGRMGKAEEVANAALFLASDEASFITGSTIVVDGGRMLHV